MQFGIKFFSSRLLIGSQLKRTLAALGTGAALVGFAPAANADWLARFFQFDRTLTNIQQPIPSLTAEATDFDFDPGLDSLDFGGLFAAKPALALLPQDIGTTDLAVDTRGHAMDYDLGQVEENKASIPVTATIEVQPGSSLLGILQSQGIVGQERRDAASKIDAVFSLTKLRAGWKVNVGYDASVPEGELGRLVSVNFAPNQFESVTLTREGDEFVVEQVKDEVAEIEVRYAGTIEDGFWVDLQAAGFSERLIANFQNTLSGRVDLGRQVQKGANYEIVFEARVRESGEIVRTGNVLYASIEVGDLSKRGETDLTKEVYFFEPPNSRTGYFTPAGNGLRRGITFLRRPTSGRVTSHFNPRRRNPVSGRVRPHEGTDFGAPTGTPIVASADGVITRRSTWGGYGKIIVIDHGGGWTTRYAHMSRYASGLRVGSRVTQNQTIGFVGSTGNSTGPHLHFEIRRGGTAIDPIRARLPERLRLTGSDVRAFERHKGWIANLRRTAPLFGEDVYID